MIEQTEESETEMLYCTYCMKETEHTITRSGRYLCSGCKKFNVHNTVKKGGKE